MRSIEYGFSALTVMGMPCFLAYSMQSVRLLSVHSRQGAMTFTSGSKNMAPSSKRTWSLPFPVAPWEMASAPVSFTVFIMPSMMQGRASEVPSKYSPS